MPITSWICGSVCSAKFFGLPPPRIQMADFPPLRLASSTIAAVSFTSALASKRSLLPSSAIAATFMPIELSPGEEV